MISILRFDHLVLTTADPGACVGFYQCLGMVPDYANNRIALKFGQQKINVHLPQSNLTPLAANVTIGNQSFHLASSGEQNIAVQKLHACGIGLKSNTASTAHIEDLDNNFITIDYSGSGPKPEITSLLGITLKVANMDASLSFYAGILGMKEFSHTLVFEHGEIRLTENKDQNIPKGMKEGSGDFCLLVRENIYEVYDWLKQKSAPFESSADIVHRHGATGPINSIYLRDPDGNLVEISRYAAGH